MLMCWTQSTANKQSHAPLNPACLMCRARSCCASAAGHRPGLLPWRPQPSPPAIGSPRRRQPSRCILHPLIGIDANLHVFPVGHGVHSRSMGLYRLQTRKVDLFHQHVRARLMLTDSVITEKPEWPAESITVYASAASYNRMFLECAVAIH